MGKDLQLMILSEGKHFLLANWTSEWLVMVWVLSKGHPSLHEAPCSVGVVVPETCLNSCYRICGQRLKIPLVGALTLLKWFGSVGPSVKLHCTKCTIYSLKVTPIFYCAVQSECSLLNDISYARFWFRKAVSASDFVFFPIQPVCINF